LQRRGKKHENRREMRHLYSQSCARRSLGIDVRVKVTYRMRKPKKTPLSSDATSVLVRGKIRQKLPSTYCAGQRSACTKVWMKDDYSKNSEFDPFVASGRAIITLVPTLMMLSMVIDP
jgi:hypothetical protein